MLLLNNPTDTTEIVRKTTWILLAVALGALEFFFPRIPLFPWLKPGLSNCITLIWIIEYGVTDALLFFLLRAWIAGFYFGFSFFTIALSVSGGLIATLAMGCCWIAFGKRRIMGTIGISITGALMHNAGQLVTVYYLMAKNSHLFYQLPVMLAASMVFGGIVGILTPVLMRFLKHEALPCDAQLLMSRSSLSVARDTDTIICIFILGACTVLTTIKSMIVLGLCASAAATAAQILTRGALWRLVQPVTRFWLLFVFVACLHLFFSFGTSLPYCPFITREGALLTAQQWLRLWTWLELSSVLRFFNFHTVVYRALSRLFPDRQETLYAGILALDFFPEVIQKIQAEARIHWRSILRHPVRGRKNALRILYLTVVSIISAKKTPRVEIEADPH